LLAVIRQAPANVAILIDKGLGELGKIVVPYLGEHQDRGALLAAERLSRLPGVSVTILHVVRPHRGSEDRLKVEAEVDEEFSAGASQSNVRLQVVESAAPIDLVVQESGRYDLVVLGLSAEWDLHSVSLFGKHESIATRSKCSLLIVHANSLAPVVQRKRVGQTMKDQGDRQVDSVPETSITPDY
jgi:nucleotide-binding universal stress UspA family protein